MLFKLKNILPAERHYPMFKEDMPAIYQALVNRPTKYRDIDYWIERTPETIAIITAILTDVKSDGFRFDGGKQAVNKAVQFCKDNRFQEQFKNVLWDWLIYGDAYLWVGLISETQFKEAENSVVDNIKKIYKENGIEIKVPKFNLRDEDALKKIKHVPANTMNIDHDKYKITRFRQIVGTQEIIFNVNEIIHAKLITNKGKVYGFSPVHSILPEMQILGYLKDYAGTFFKYGGVPDWMFILPKEQAGSPNHTELVQRLEKYRHPVNKHGNLVFTGEVTTEKVGAGLSKDMEYRELAIYLTGVLATAHNMPVSRLASILGGRVRIQAGADDLANEGYWNKISEHQDYWEDLLNHQLWEKYFNVKIRFNRGWKINEIKEQQRNMFAIQNIGNLNNQLSRYEKQVNLEYIKKILYLDDGDLEKGDKDKIIDIQGSPKQMDDLAIRRGAGTEAQRAEKQKQVRPESSIDKGQISPKSEYKSIVHNVDLNLFLEEANYWVKGSPIRKIYYSVKGNNLTAVFSTPDENFVFENKINNISKKDLNEIYSMGKEVKNTKI